MVGQEHQPAAGSQQARRLGDPGVRVGPQRGAVLADREVERGVGVGDALGVAEQEREVEAVLGLEPGRGLELLGRVVDADGPRAATRQPRRDVAGAAAELDGVEARRGRRAAGGAPPPGRRRCPTSRRPARAPSSARRWRRTRGRTSPTRPGCGPRGPGAPGAPRGSRHHRSSAPDRPCQPPRCLARAASRISIVRSSTGRRSTCTCPMPRSRHASKARATASTSGGSALGGAGAAGRALGVEREPDGDLERRGVARLGLARGDEVGTSLREALVGEAEPGRVPGVRVLARSAAAPARPWPR